MTPEEYKDYQASVDRELKGLTAISSGYCPGCSDCEESVQEYAGEKFIEASFSSRSCEVCNSHLGGDRSPVHACDSNGDILHFEACQDCVYFLEYGQLDDMSMMEIEKGTDR